MARRGAGAHVTLSVGVATQVPSLDIGPDCLLGQADQALYAAKRLGRNRVISAETMLAEIARLNGGKLAGSRAAAHRDALSASLSPSPARAYIEASMSSGARLPCNPFPSSSTCSGF